MTTFGARKSCPDCGQAARTVLRGLRLATHFRDGGDEQCSGSGRDAHRLPVAEEAPVRVAMSIVVEVDPVAWREVHRGELTPPNVMRRIRNRVQSDLRGIGVLAEE